MEVSDKGTYKCHNIILRILLQKRQQDFLIKKWTGLIRGRQATPRQATPQQPACTFACSFSHQHACFFSSCGPTIPRSTAPPQARQGFTGVVAAVVLELQRDPSSPVTLPSFLHLCRCNHHWHGHGAPVLTVGTGGDHRVLNLGASLKPVRLPTASLCSNKSQVHLS